MEKFHKAALKYDEILIDTYERPNSELLRIIDDKKQEVINLSRDFIIENLKTQYCKTVFPRFSHRVNPKIWPDPMNKKYGFPVNVIDKIWWGGKKIRIRRKGGKNRNISVDTFDVREWCNLALYFEDAMENIKEKTV